MPWPLVTRKTMDDAVRERDYRIADLQQLLRSEHERVLDLNNQIVWRATGIPLDPTRLPAEYRPVVARPEEAENTDVFQKKVPSEREAAARKAGKSVRQVMRAMEQQREKEFREPHSVVESAFPAAQA